MQVEKKSRIRRSVIPLAAGLIALLSSTPVAIAADLTTFSGTVQAAGGPVAGLYVELTGSGSGGSTTTAADGSFSVQAPAGSVHLTVAAGNTTVTFTLPASRKGTAVAITSAANPSTAGQSGVITATATTQTPGTGTLTFTIDGTANAPVALTNNGRATIRLSTLSTGTPTITATYNGDTDRAPSTSPTHTQTVQL